MLVYVELLSWDHSMMLTFGNLKETYNIRSDNLFNVDKCGEWSPNLPSQGLNVKNAQLK